MVQLFEEDLCSSVSIGDVLDIVGQAELKLPKQAAAARCLAEIQVGSASIQFQASAACFGPRKLHVSSSVIEALELARA